MNWPPPPVPGRRSRLQMLSQAVVTVLLPWRAAAWLFRPRGRVVDEDRVMAILGRNRAILGMATIVFAALRYGEVGKALSPEVVLIRWLVTVGLAVPLLAACIAALVLAIRPGRRRPALLQMRWPVFALFGFVAVTGVFAFWVRFGNRWVTETRVAQSLGGQYADFGGPLGLWMVVFWVYSAYLISRHWFNSADGHPLLPPLMATAVAWLAVAVDAVRGATNGLPVDVATFLAVGGATVTTCLAGAEWWRLRRRYGISPRSGPWPAYNPAPSPPAPHP